MFSLKTSLIIFSLVLELSLCRDFYMGMFKRNDFLVAQDRIFKPRIPYRSSQAKFGRIFKCKITYVSVRDRLGIGRGPRVEIIRGGLQNKLVVLRITSVYNYPLSVNVYVGCDGQPKTTTKQTTIKETPKPTEKVTTKQEKPTEDSKATTKSDDGNTAQSSDPPNAGNSTSSGNKTMEVQTVVPPATE